MSSLTCRSSGKQLTGNLDEISDSIHVTGVLLHIWSRCCYSMTFGSLYFLFVYDTWSDKITLVILSLYLHLHYAVSLLCFYLISRNYGPLLNIHFCLPLSRIPSRHSSSTSVHDSHLILVLRAMTPLHFIHHSIPFVSWSVRTIHTYISRM